MLAAVVGSVDGDSGAGVGDDQRPRGHAQRPLPQLLGDVVDRRARKLFGLVPLSTYKLEYFESSTTAREEVMKAKLFIRKQTHRTLYYRFVPTAFPPTFRWCCCCG